MNKTRRTHGTILNLHKNLVRKTKWKRHLRRLQEGVDGRIILKWVSNRVYTWPLAAGCREHFNEPLVP